MFQRNDSQEQINPEWTPPICFAQALSQIGKDENLFLSLRAYVSHVLRRYFSELGTDAIDDLFQRAIYKLLHKRHLPARFSALFGKASLAAYFTRTAIRLHLDDFRQTQRRKRRLRAMETKRIPANGGGFYLDIEFRKKLAGLAVTVRNLIHRRRWNALVNKIDPRWRISGDPFTPWPDVKSSDNATTQRSDLYRARDELFQLLPNDLDEAERQLIRRIFFGRSDPWTK